MNISGYPAQPQGHSSPLQGFGPSPGCCVNKGLLSLNHSLRNRNAKINYFPQLLLLIKKEIFLPKHRAVILIRCVLKKAFSYSVQLNLDNSRNRKSETLPLAIY